MRLLCAHLRWLVARKGDVKAAEAALGKHVEWRRGEGRPRAEDAPGIRTHLEHKKVCAGARKCECECICVLAPG